MVERTDSADDGGEFGIGIAVGNDGEKSDRIGGLTIVDPSAFDGNGPDGDASGTGSETGKRKRGRPRGSKGSAAPTKAARNHDLSGIESILVSLHAMAAAAIKIPELNLSEAEARTLVSATQEVARQYNVAVSAKTAAWVNLGMAVGSIYGSRAVAIALKAKKEKKDNIVQFPTPPEMPKDNVKPIREPVVSGGIDWNKQMEMLLNPKNDAKN